jgi:hypothetical protein
LVAALDLQPGYSTTNLVDILTVRPVTRRRYLQRKTTAPSPSHAIPETPHAGTALIPGRMLKD